ncbi:MAG TPA: hypothetical protein VN278_04445 [Methanosarcina sp.]|nr:hypothetical protein [Methanosarcina sp.]
MEITREKLADVLFQKMTDHSSMMDMFRKTHGVKCFGYIGHERGYLRAQEFYHDILDGEAISPRRLSAYMGKGYTLVEKEGVGV